MKKIIFGGIIFLFLFINFAPVSAAELIVCGGKGQSPCRLCDFFILIDNLADFLLFTIVPPVAALMLAIAGAMFFLGGSNPGMVKDASGLLTRVVVGLIIMYSSWLIVNCFFMLIGLNEAGTFGFNLKQWFEIPCY